MTEQAREWVRVAPRLLLCALCPVGKTRWQHPRPGCARRQSQQHCRLPPALLGSEPRSRSRSSHFTDASALPTDELPQTWKDKLALPRLQLQGSERLPFSLNLVLYGLPHQAIL